MTWRLLGTHIAVVAAALAMFGVPLANVVADLQLERLTADLVRDAVIIANSVEESLEDGATGVDPGLDEYLAATDARLVITDAAGISVFDPENPGVRRDYSTREEIGDALEEGERTVGQRYSDTLGTDLRYVAVPVASNGVVHGVVRLTATTAQVDRAVRSTWGLLGGLALLALSVAGLIAIWLSRWVAGPTARLAGAVTAFTEGDATARADASEGPAEVRDVAARFNRMAARMSELLDSQQQFVATASHQLRSPLQAMRLELESALAGDVVDPAAVARAVEENRRLGRVVDGLLAIARVDATAGEVVELDVADLLGSRAEVWQALADEQGVALTMSLPPSVPPVSAVDGHAEQVLDNLIANALDAQPDGGAVSLGAMEDGDRVQLLVQDRGPGLDQADLARAFDRFWRGSDGEGGSGLGLPIARQLARASGGDVTLEVRDGGGLRAVLSLPAATR